MTNEKKKINKLYQSLRLRPDVPLLYMSFTVYTYRPNFVIGQSSWLSHKHRKIMNTDVKRYL